MNNDEFYAQLPLQSRFDLITQLNLYRPIPSDWHVVITDIRGSTKAIEAGRYKDVNTLGASTIIAVLNAVGALDIPFVFGGDGATLLVPESQLAACRRALISSRELAKTAFGLELRAGIVPVRRIRADGFEVNVTKVAISGNYNQAMFSGGGLAHAEQLIKDSVTGPTFLIEESGAGDGSDFEGLECRWNDIRVPDQEILSLIVVARGDEQARTDSYRSLLQHIERIFGSVSANPVTKNSLKVSLSLNRLGAEAAVRTMGQGLWARLKYLATAYFENIIGLWTLNKSGEHFGTDWQRYQVDLLQNTDSKKFDDTLRMIFSATEFQKRALLEQLQTQHAGGKIFYGVHVASHALMTCLVFDTKGRHIHFVDGGDGGYALAAKGLKAQIKESKAAPGAEPAQRA